MAGREGAGAGDAALTPRARARALLRAGTKRPPVSLFMPLAHAVAAHVESLPLRAFVTSPQKLANGLVALRDILQTDALTVACGAGIECEALGARTEWSTGEPAMHGSIVPAALDGDDLAARLAGGARLAVALEATRRLSDVRGEPLLVAGLTGPCELAAQLRALGALDGGVEDAAALEAAGRVVLETARLFLNAGCSALVIIESAAAGAAPAAWTSTVGTIAKLARFYDALPLVAFDGDARTTPPAAAIGCPLAGTPFAAAAPGPAGIAFPADVRAWPQAATSANAITTYGDIRPGVPIDEVRRACAAVNAPAAQSM